MVAPDFSPGRSWTSSLTSSVTRRGVLVGAVGLGTALAIRERPAEVAPRAVPADRAYPSGDLISPLALAERLASDAPLLVLDASALADFRGGHIPGARHIWWQDTMELNAPYYGMVLKPDDGASDQGRRQALLERLSVTEGAAVVVYDRDDGWPAARVAWFLRFLSVPAQVLDGGYAGWLALDPAARDLPANPPGGPIATARPQTGFYFSAEEMAERLGLPDAQIVDVRTESERRAGAMAGWVTPDTVWLPRTELIGASGLLKPAAELSALLAGAGVELDRTLIPTGETGLDASAPWLALTLMGAANVAIGDGGWQQWAVQPELPVIPL